VILAQTSPHELPFESGSFRSNFAGKLSPNGEIVKDPYEILGVARIASPDDIRQAHRIPGGEMLDRLAIKIAEDSQPLRDTFAVLFFVSVGMLFDPGALIEQPLQIAAVVGIVILGKGLAALAITTFFKLPLPTGLMIAVALAQIGEFSFVLAGLGRQLGVLSDTSYNLILAAALISIALNPFLFGLVERFADKPPRSLGDTGKESSQSP
jgi:predicted Kef-type K+ transport protein